MANDLEIDFWSESAWNNRIYVKGIVSWDQYILEGPNAKTVLFDWALIWFLQFLVVLLWRKSKLKFLLASMKSLTNSEIPSSNFLRTSCSGVLIAACVSKSCSETRLWSWKLFRKPAMNEHWKKSTNENKGKPEHKFCAAFGRTLFKISKCFQRSKQKHHINFLLY